MVIFRKCFHSTGPLFGVTYVVGCSGRLFTRHLPQTLKQHGFLPLDDALAIRPDLPEKGKAEKDPVGSAFLDPC